MIVCIYLCVNVYMCNVGTYVCVPMVLSGFLFFELRGKMVNSSFIDLFNF